MEKPALPLRAGPFRFCFFSRPGPPFEKHPGFSPSRESREKKARLKRPVSLAFLGGLLYLAAAKERMEAHAKERMDAHAKGRSKEHGSPSHASLYPKNPPAALRALAKAWRFSLASSSSST
jgi:hypothetical protein